MLCIDCCYIVCVVLCVVCGYYFVFLSGVAFDIYIYIYSGRGIISRHENLGTVLVGSQNTFLEKTYIPWASLGLLRLFHITSGSGVLEFASGDCLAHFGCRNGTQVFGTEGDVFWGTGHYLKKQKTKSRNKYNYNYNTTTTQFNMQLQHNARTHNTRTIRTYNESLEFVGFLRNPRISE